MLSFNIQQVYFGKEAIIANVSFIPLCQIFTEKLPMAIGYILNFSIVSARMEDR